MERLIAPTIRASATLARCLIGESIAIGAGTSAGKSTSTALRCAPSTITTTETTTANTSMKMTTVEMATAMVMAMEKTTDTAMVTSARPEGLGPNAFLFRQRGLIFVRDAMDKSR